MSVSVLSPQRVPAAQSAQSGAADRRYADWIAQYISAEFVQAAEWLKAEMNRLAEAATPSKRRRLMEIFEISSQYEWLFWEMCWTGEAWPIPRAAGATG